MVFLVVLAGVFGAVIGSFLSVVAHRVPERKSIVSPGSACPACDRQLRWRDNVPVLSWVVARGCCAHCGAAISPRYPALEVGTAIAFAAVVAVRGLDERLVLDLPFVATLIVLTTIDVERRLVPNPILVFAGVYGLVALIATDPGAVAEHAIAAVAAFAAFLLIALAYPAGMGMGDVKLAGVIGLYLGLSVLPAMLIAFLAGTAVGVGLIAHGGAAARKRAVPFVPFLALGAFAGLLAGPELIDAYTSRFL